MPSGKDKKPLVIDDQAGRPDDWPDDPKDPAAKRGVGRPRIEIDNEELEKLAAMQCTMIEMAAFFNCSVDTLENNFSDIIKRGKENGKASLRREQTLVAMGVSGPLNPGKTTMLIWLGKNLLGQTDRSSVDVQGGLTVVWDKELDKI